MEEHNIVTMRADITKSTPETDRALRTYESKGIPLLVIIPPETPDKPIIVRDIYTRDVVLAKLREAVGRKGGDPPGERTASRQQAALK